MTAGAPVTNVPFSRGGQTEKHPGHDNDNYDNNKIVFFHSQPKSSNAAGLYSG
jgi:hypothetical protein